jgi:hypothetical protein
LLLSGYNPISDYDLYWSNGDDCENKMVKEAMSRDRFRMIKTAIYFGSMENKEGETPDGYKKVRLLIQHMQNWFSDMMSRSRTCHMTRP